MMSVEGRLAAPLTGQREAEPTGGPSAAGGLMRPLFRLAPVAADGQHVAVVQEPVEDRSGDHRIGKHGPPFGNAAVRRDQHGAGSVVAVVNCTVYPDGA